MFIKEDLEKLILKDQISYREIGKMYNVSDTFIKKKAKELGIILPIKAQFPERWKPFNTGKKKSKETGKYLEASLNYCKNCNTELNNPYKIFCSNKCQGEYRKNQTFIKYKLAIENNTDIQNYKNISTVKPFVLQEQNCKCAICNIENKWNEQELRFILDHIDGNASNNKRNNLRLICHNCDSQLDTYKSKNKNSARKDRYLSNYKLS